MKRMKFLGVALIAGIVSFVSMVSVGFAATLYVSPTEGIYNDINSAIAAALPGDEIVVKPGTYPAVDVNKKVHIRSERGPEVTKIIGSGEFGIRFNAIGSNSSVSGFYIKGSNYGVYLYVVSGSGNTLANTIIKNNIISGSSMYGIFLNSNGANIDYTTIENNVIVNNGINGIQFYSKDYNCNSSPNKLNSTTTNNNIIFNHTNYGIQYVSGCNPGFINNTFYNNIIFNNLLGTTSNVTVLASDGNIFNDPLFVDANTGNYMLQAASPAIDAGRIGTAFNDPDGSRNNIGVYGGPGAASFWPYPASGPVVTNLSVFPASVPQGGTITITATGSVR